MASPIRGLDHVTILARDLDAAAADAERLLGRHVVVRSEAGGIGTALLVLDNMAVEIAARCSAGTDGERLATALAGHGEGLASVCFRCDDIARMHRRLTQLRLAPEPVTQVVRRNALTGDELRWQRTRAATEATHGVRQFFLSRQHALPVSPVEGEGAVTGLDHMLVETSYPERAMALYGARLGLDMRFDSERRDWGVRLMFFRCGDLIVEIVHRLDAPVQETDRLGGLSWRVRDAAAAHARLQAAGVAVSEIRRGRKPGTRVFSVKSHTVGVPTVFIEPAVSRY